MDKSVMHRCSSGDNSEFLKIEFDDSVHKHFGVLCCVPLGNINSVGFKNHRVDLAGILIQELVHGRHRFVVVKPVLSADNPEAQNPVVVVEELEPLGAGGGWEAGDYSHFPDASYSAIAGDEAAAFDEVFVALWVVEAADERPNHRGGGVDSLGYEGGAGAWVRFKPVVSFDNRFESFVLLVG